MIKAAFFDIDGTLLSFRSHRVSPGTLRAFDRLHRQGILTFISSGRPKILIPAMPVSFSGLITMNGALVLGSDGRHLLSNPIPQADTERWIDYARDNNICTMLFTADGMLASQINDTGLALRSQLEFQLPPIVDIECLRGAEAYQIIALMPPTCDADVAAFLPHCRLPRWHDLFTDIVADGNSKARGMDVLCRHFGIRQEETIAFGDGANDIEMLRWAGIGVAMGNAAPTVKEAADFITADVDNEGIEQAINTLLHESD